MEQVLVKGKHHRAIDWCWLICIISFVGFIVENFWNALTSRQLDNRNMHLPFILGYGLAILGIYLLFGTPTDNNGVFNISNKSNTILLYVKYALLVTVFICVCEIIIGYTVQYLSGIYYWDFSDVPLHISRYTSIITSTIYSIIITVFMSRLFDRIMAWLSRFEDKAFIYVGVVLFVLLVIDMLVSYETMIVTNDYNLIWHIDLF